MVDSLGYRMKFGVIAPSTNTSVQPEFENMRPRGVTNHFARIHIPDDPVENDDDFNTLMDNIRANLMESIDRVITCDPGAIVVGMSAETFWDGLDGSKILQAKLEERAQGRRVTMGSDACLAALKAYGGIKRIAVITPYMPVGDKNVHKFFTDCGSGIKSSTSSRSCWALNPLSTLQLWRLAPYCVRSRSTRGRVSFTSLLWSITL